MYFSSPSIRLNSLALSNSLSLSPASASFSGPVLPSCLHAATSECLLPAPPHAPSALPHPQPQDQAVVTHAVPPSWRSGASATQCGAPSSLPLQAIASSHTRAHPCPLAVIARSEFSLCRSVWCLSGISDISESEPEISGTRIVGYHFL